MNKSHIVYESYREGSIAEEECEEFHEEREQKSVERYFAFIDGVEKILSFHLTKVTRVINAEASAFLRGARYMAAVGLVKKI